LWFADVHTFLPVIFSKVFGKKSFVVIGGYDVARIRSLNYGVFISKFRGFCAIYSMKNCSINLTVSNYIDRKTRWLTKSKNTRMIYNCMDLPENKNENYNKENLILTVGLINSENTYYLKGIDTFIETARIMPKYRFLVIGAEKELIRKLVKNVPQNLEIIGKTQHKKLTEYYKKAKIYCQFSRSEAFGVAIVEAMSLGCIPLVTNVGGMPEIVNNNQGVINRNLTEISTQIEKITCGIENQNLLSDSEIKKFISKFSFGQRKINILSNLSIQN
jgi:glycosyltransferase involved in cell wall biosynthesis